MRIPTRVLRGAAALSEMLDCIGADPSEGMDDAAVAKILVENEESLRELLRASARIIGESLREAGR